MRSIDIHAHLTPQCFWRTTENGGDWHGITREQNARGHELAVIAGSRSDLPPRARYTPEQRLADMDSLGVDIHVLSPYSGFYNHHLDVAIAKATSQDSNNEIHDMMQSWPERFAGLATLPMQDVNAAIAELERVMVQLGFKGAMIDDKINGVTLDAPEFLPFCLDRGWQVRSEAHIHIQKPPSHYQRCLYYDCVIDSDPALRYLLDQVGSDRVVLGSDWPFVQWDDSPVTWVQSLESVSQEEKDRILWQNLEMLLGV